MAGRAAVMLLLASGRLLWSIFALNSQAAVCCYRYRTEDRPPKEPLLFFPEIEGSVGQPDLIHSTHSPIAWNRPRKGYPFPPPMGKSPKRKRKRSNRRSKNCPSTVRRKTMWTMTIRQLILEKVGGVSQSPTLLRLAARKGG